MSNNDLNIQTNNLDIQTNNRDIQIREQNIEELLTKKKFIYTKIENEDSLNKIYNLLINDIFEEPKLGVEYLYYGHHYNFKKDYIRMKKYYFMAIYYDYSYAMKLLGNYYKHNKDDENMKKYYLMFLKKEEDSSIMNKLGIYYKKQQDFDNAVKYYLMAVEKQNKFATFNLGLFYKQKNDFPKMRKYFMKSLKIDKNFKHPFSELEKYYKEEKMYYRLIKLCQLVENEVGLIDALSLYFSKRRICSHKLEKIFDILVDIDLEKNKKCPI